MKSMQLLLLKFALFLALFLPVFSAKASHVMGSEITYQCSGTPGVYNVTVKLYKDCSGVQLCANCPSSLSSLCNISIDIRGYASPTGSGMPSSPCAGVSFGTQTLTVVTSVSGFDIVQLCNSAKTICSNCGSRTPGTFTPGVEIYTFTGQINLSGIPASCCFISIGWNTCCRNDAITTLANPSSLNFYSEAIINRCATPCNSSPTLAFESEIVVPAGKDYILNLGATDPDGDSLSYHMGQALVAIVSSAPYSTPYSPSVPFPYLGAPSQSPPLSPPFGITMNPINGNYRFRPQGSFVAPIVIEIKQWKTIAGIPTLMGITRKDQILYSQLMPANNAPIIRFDTSNITGYTYSKYDTICAGQAYCKTIVASDVDVLDTTDLTWNLPNVVSNSGGTITKMYNNANRNTNGPRQDSIKFCWTPPNTAGNNRPHYLNIIAKDRRCPIKEKTLLNIGLVVKLSPIANIIYKTPINDSTYKFRYASSSPNNPILTQWKIETTPGSNIYNTINADSIQSYTFTNFGWHKIKLTLTGNCIGTERIDSIIVNKIKLNVIVAKNLNCKNDSSGRIIIKAIDGFPPYKYVIKAGAHSPIINNYEYSTKDTFNSLAANTYTIYVKDSNTMNYDGLYSGIKIVTLTQPLNSIAINVLSKKRPTCNGDSNGVITIGALNNVGPFQVKLDTGNFQSNYSFSNLKPAVRQFTIKDSLGCMITQSVSLTDPPVLNRSITTLSHIKCKGDSNAFISLNVSGGISPYRMRINGSAFQTNSTFFNQKVGSKLIEVVDSNDCLKTISTIVNEPATKVSVSVLSKTNISCASALGSATLIASGGTLPYKYGRVNGPATSPSPKINNLPAGIYTFLVRDSNNCQAEVVDTIVTLNPLNLVLSKKDISCNGLKNGIITCATSGGMGKSVYRYKLDAGPFGDSNVFLNVSPGVHLITVKDTSLIDTSSCLKTELITVNEPSAITSTIVSTNTSCVGANTGTAEVFVSGGKMPYTYSWNTSPIQNTAKATKLPAGKVMVTIADSNSCLRKDSVVIGAKTLFNDEAICAVSVDSITNQNLIVWNKTPDKGTAAYQIWVAPNGTAIPTLLTTIPVSYTHLTLPTKRIV